MKTTAKKPATNLIFNTNKLLIKNYRKLYLNMSLINTRFRQKKEFYVKLLFINNDYSTISQVGSDVFLKRATIHWRFASMSAKASLQIWDAYLPRIILAMI